jgi:hypothetical protein
MIANAVTQAALTAALTLIGGCVLFVFSQFITQGIIKPYIEYRKVLAGITHTFVYYKNIIVSAPPDMLRQQQDAISAELREHCATLRSSVTALPFHSLLRLFRLIPSQSRIVDAAGYIIRISNRLLDTQEKKYDEIVQDMRAVGELLHIDAARS